MAEVSVNKTVYFSKYLKIKWNLQTTQLLGRILNSNLITLFALTSSALNSEIVQNFHKMVITNL